MVLVDIFPSLFFFFILSGKDYRYRKVFVGMTSVTEKNGPRGAGAILYSSLATAGWRFPSITLVEADEKYLFDLEVHLQ